RAIAHAVHACREALEDAGFAGGKAREPERTALVLGSSLAASASSPEFWQSVAERGLAATDPGLARDYVAEPLLDEIARALSVRGETLLVANACASGGSSIALAADLVNAGRARVAIAAGFDALDAYTLAGFASLKALARGPARPFAAEPEGMNLGDGFAAIVL